MTATIEDLNAATDLRDALAHRIANDAVRGKLPDSISRDLYAEYEARVKQVTDEIMDAAKLPRVTA